MDVVHEMLYLELRQSEQELKESLQNKQDKDWLKPILEDELSDIVTAISKLKKGNFGQCEISGEFIPNELLNMVPTLKSLKDFKDMDLFYRKTITSPFSKP